MYIRKIYKSLFLFIVTFSLFACNSSQDKQSISGKNISISYNNKLYSRVDSDYLQNSRVTNEFSPSEYIIVDNEIVKDFEYESESKEINDGTASLTISGTYKNKSVKILKELNVKIYDDFNDFAFTKVRYTNKGNDSLLINGWVNNDYILPQTKDTSQVFWSYQSGSYENRPDWVLPVKVGFKQDNYMGMNEIGRAHV